MADVDLDFGAMKMLRGKAFLAGEEDDGIPVAKQWLNTDGRDILVEEVQMNSIASLVAGLPRTASVGTASGQIKRTATIQPSLPSHPRMAGGPAKQEMRLAKAAPPINGLVLDYAVNVVSQTGYTFRGDTTYYLSGAVNLSGTINFEGGAVLKYASNASLTISDSGTSHVNWQADAYRPVTFTAKNDSSVGDAVSGASGNPSGFYANPALSFYSLTPPPIAHFRIAYAKQAVLLEYSSPSFYHGQIVNCQNGISAAEAGAYFGNLLFANVQIALNEWQYADVNAANVTFAGGTNSMALASQSQTGNPFHHTFTNCIFYNVYSFLLGGVDTDHTVSGDHNGVDSSTTLPTELSALTASAYPFQTKGAGDFYLTDAGGLRDQGTTNIDTTLLASLKRRTTYPPVNPPTANPAGTTWPQTVQRDSDKPDLGFHYAPLDYWCSGYAISGALHTLASGVAVGFYGTSGFIMQGGFGITSAGQANAMNHFVWYPSVQEQPGKIGNFNPTTSALFNISSAGGVKIIALNFTDVAMQGYRQKFFDAGTIYNQPRVTLKDCQLRGVKFEVTSSLDNTPSVVADVTLQNNLWERCSVNLFNGCVVYSPGGSPTLYQNPLPVALYNNLFWSNTVTLSYLDDQASNHPNWGIRDNLFDGCAVSLSGNGAYATYLGKSCNARYTTTMPAPLTDATDVTLNTLVYAPGPLGNRYINLYSTSPTVIEKGSRTAVSAGLADHTLRGDQLPDVCTVDIGFHYQVVNGDIGSLDADDLVINVSPTPEQLARLLVGPEVTVQNVTYTGAALARGTFAGGTSAGLPIESGVILGSGHVTDAIGPNTSDADQGQGVSTDYGLPNGDSDLNGLFPGTVGYDAAVLEFDIISPANSISFQLVFASEEYYYWVNHIYNDVCAIFVDGVDIALVPGTSDPVSVISINDGSYPALYLDNQYEPPLVFPTYNTQYNGLTVNFTAQTQISPNVVHHVKIAVEDVLDNGLDSAMFVKAQISCD